MSENDTKRTFVICPIGLKESDERKRSDDIFSNLIKPICKAEGYNAYRTIDEDQPGNITERVIKELKEAELVIADLSGRNPNVFYELAIRHTTGLPFILMSDDIANVPFDVGFLSVIDIKFTNCFGDLCAIQKELTNHIRQVESHNANFSNPVFEYEQKQALMARGTETDNILLQILARLADLENICRHGTTAFGRPTVTIKTPTGQQVFPEEASPARKSAPNQAL